jgi:hypothetical protein
MRKQLSFTLEGCAYGEVLNVHVGLTTLLPVRLSTKLQTQIAEFVVGGSADGEIEGVYCLVLTVEFNDQGKRINVCHLPQLHYASPCLA